MAFATPHPHRHFDGGRLVIASHNAGKVREIHDLLRRFQVEVVSAAELGLDEPEETGSTFVENAELKALAAARASGLAALADDSGLAADALDGAPGIYSARWAGADRDFAVAMSELERQLAARGDGHDAPSANRAASFRCALCLAWPDGHCETFEGRVAGQLIWPPRGARGFGYDPAFVADGYEITFGEMDPDEKHRISHRADAFRQLVAACFEKP